MPAVPSPPSLTSPAQGVPRMWLVNHGAAGTLRVSMWQGLSNSPSLSCSFCAAADGPEPRKSTRSASGRIWHIAFGVVLLWKLPWSNTLMLASSYAWAG